MMLNAPTPLQLADAKAACGDALLLFRCGDFYEAFGQDARTLSLFCGLTLTRTDSTSMAGFPYHFLDRYLAHLVAKGCRVAVCEKCDYVSAAKMTHAVERTLSESQRRLFS